MHKVEFTAGVKFGDKDITSIEVAPLTFVDMAKLWDKASTAPRGKHEAVMQRLRIQHQVHFKAGDTRVVPDDVELGQVPFIVVRDVIAGLDVGQGELGEITIEGDGASTPIVYKLGTPIEMKSGKDTVYIKELEFFATTYGEVEDVLAAGSETNRAIALLSSLANPVGIDALPRLPGWALDKITVADGLQVMRKVAPSF